jgi:signal transduction histidine kinase
LGLAVFVVFVVLAAGAEALLPRRSQARPEAAEDQPPAARPDDLSFAPQTADLLSAPRGDDLSFAPRGDDLSFALRSGLTPIRGYAEILADRVHGDDDRRMVRAIEHHADRLTVLAERLQTTSCSSSAASP